MYHQLKSVQKLTLSAKRWNCLQKSEIERKTVKLKMIDSAYFDLGQTKWRTKIKRRLKFVI